MQVDRHTATASQR